MSSIGRKVGTIGAALSAIAFFGVGCAQEVGDIDRTQPDKLEKALFDSNDEWYYRQTVVDTDDTAAGGLLFEGYYSSLKRIRWQVTEDFLFACSTVAPVLGDELRQNFDENVCEGVVAAYPISSHFDVQRSYTATTGEQSNVIQENTSDRPWYERKYMRVDWTQNVVDGRGMFQSYLGTFTPVSTTPNQEDAEVDPDRVRISPDYIETTTAYTF